MERVLTGKQSKFIDEYTIKNIKIPSIVLMERASYEISRDIYNKYNVNNKILVAVGVGNNGADGLAAARILDSYGFYVDVYVVGNIHKATEEFKLQYEILKNINISVIQYSKDINIEFKKYEIIIDGLFGIGLSRKISGDYFEIIKQINNTKANILSIDIPSGICADTGKVMGICVNAKTTYALGNIKVGHLTGYGREYCGEVLIKDIGLRKESYTKLNSIGDNFIFAIRDFNPSIIPNRKKCTNKGSFGKVAVIAGNSKMYGAAYFSAMSAYRAGCGIVKVFSCNENVNLLKQDIKEAIVDTYENKELLIKSFEDCKVIVIGPGLGISEEAYELVKLSLESEKVVVLDADGLNIVGKHRELLNKFGKNVIITPHVLEMSRLTDLKVSDIIENAVESANDFSKKYGCICVLKNSTTVVTSCDNTIPPENELFDHTFEQKNIIYLNSTGNSGMSTGGMGDVLSGIIASFVAQNLTPFYASVLGVYLHGLIGDKQVEKLSENSLMASDIVNGLSKIFEKKEQCFKMEV